MLFFLLLLPFTVVRDSQADFVPLHGKQFLFAENLSTSKTGALPSQFPSFKEPHVEFQPISSDHADHYRALS